MILLNMVVPHHEFDTFTGTSAIATPQQAGLYDSGFVMTGEDEVGVKAVRSYSDPA